MGGLKVRVTPDPWPEELGHGGVVTSPGEGEGGAGVEETRTRVRPVGTGLPVRHEVERGAPHTRGWSPAEAGLRAHAPTGAVTAIVTPDLVA